MDYTRYLQPAELQSPETIKGCCVALYESDWATLLLGDSYHPGRLQLTERLGNMLDLQPGHIVLDVASGLGTSAIYLAQRFGCQVVGVDFSGQIVEQASANAAEAGISQLVQFKQGDAERLPFEGGSFDALICECAFCTFPSKPQAASQFARVLRPGGRIGLSDLTRSAPLPPELDTLLAWVACIADAQPMEEYTSILSQAGFSMGPPELHDEALAELINEVRGKLLVAELMVNLKKLEVPDWIDFDQVGRLAQITAETVNQGKLGYALFSGEITGK
jgi:ubiquinone/menaquinone biosynthesis C-methylase UbiE